MVFVNNAKTSCPEALAYGEKYRRLVRRVIYLAVTRPDLAYSVHILSQFMQATKKEHWEAVLRVVLYLKNVGVKEFFHILTMRCR